MKSLIENIIRLRNPQFQFDKNIPLSFVIEVSRSKLIEYLRSYKLIFKGILPKKIFLGKNVKVKFPARVFLGKWVKLGDYVKLSGLGTDGLYIGDNVSIGDFSRLIVSTSFNHLGKYIEIGDNVGIGEYAYLGGAGGLTIESDCIIGQYFSCHPENHNYEDNIQLIRHQGVSRKGITIGSNCWIGSKVTITDGVTIGKNSVIAAGAVVTKSFPANSVIGGIPAKLLKQIEAKKTESPKLKAI